MKTMRWIVLVIIALGAAGWMLAQAEVSKRTESDSEVQALRQQVEQLQTRLKVLEARLAKLEPGKRGAAPKVEILPQPFGTPSAPLVPTWLERFGQSRPAPKVWGSREVNGWTFYFIPCGDDPAAQGAR